MLQYPDFFQRTPGSKMGFLKTWLKSGYNVYMHEKTQDTWSWVALRDRFGNELFTVLRQLNNQQKRQRSRFIFAHWDGFTLGCEASVCLFVVQPARSKLHVAPKFMRSTPCRVAGCEPIRQHRVRRRPESEHHCGQTEEVARAVCCRGFFVWLSSGKAAACCCWPAHASV